MRSHPSGYGPCQVSREAAAQHSDRPDAGYYDRDRRPERLPAETRRAAHRGRSTAPPPRTAASACRRSATSSRWAPSAPATPAWSQLDGELVRACETPVAAGQVVFTRSDRADVAQRDAFDRLLHNHDLYCTVCDNNNQNCTVHNTTKELAVKTPGPQVRAQALPAGPFQPLLSLRPRPVHPLRTLRGSLPERAGQRDAHHRLGARSPARAVGRRRADRRLQLRQLRPLCHRLPLQCAHGKGHAREGRLSHLAAARRLSTR